MSGVSLLAARLKKESTPRSDCDKISLHRNEKNVCPKKPISCESPPKRFGAVSIHTALARSYLVDKVLASPRKNLEIATLRKFFYSWKLRTWELRSSRNSGCLVLGSVLVRNQMRQISLAFRKVQTALRPRALTVSHWGHVEIARPRLVWEYSRVAVAAVYRPHIQRHIDKIIKILAEP